jgi:hypothetical protein
VYKAFIALGRELESDPCIRTTCLPVVGPQPDKWWRHATSAKSASSEEAFTMLTHIVCVSESNNYANAESPVGWPEVSMTHLICIEEFAQSGLGISTHVITTIACVSIR